jgi:chorismate synthase
MYGNSFGKLFKFSTFGESHGPGLGLVLEGVPPGLELEEGDIQKELDRRKPGQSNVTTPRKESDKIHILSGVFEGKTTGTPIGMVLYNKDHDSSAYSDIKDKIRPGHADWTYNKKYGFRDYRGSGRASGRETSARVAAGAVAKKLLALRGVNIIAHTQRTAGISCASYNPEVIESNAVRAADAEAAKEMEKRIVQLAEEGNSTGGIVECRVQGLPAGLGEPVFDKLDAVLAHAMLSLGAVKGIEFGKGFQAVDMKGSEHNDWMREEGYVSNNAGGVLGGISTGEELVFRIAVKPTSSISSVQKTVTAEGENVDIQTHGRHDPCITPRIVPVVEAMTAVVLEDFFKMKDSSEYPHGA